MPSNLFVGDFFSPFGFLHYFYNAGAPPRGRTRALRKGVAVTLRPFRQMRNETIGVLEGWPSVSGYSPLSIHPTYLSYMSGSVIIATVSIGYTTTKSCLFSTLIIGSYHHHAFEPSTEREYNAYRFTPIPK